MALQGAFIEHEHMLQRLGANTFEVRQLSDWQQHKDGLILPGGESTTMLKLMHELGLYQPVREAIMAGMPVFGTCAGLILLATQMADELHAAHSPFPRLATMDIEVVRNAYGRQLGSFHTEAAIAADGQQYQVPMTFIRAPYINRVYGDAEALATIDGHIVAARQGHQLVTAFHPELDDDTTLHQLFLNSIG
ncbi:MAG: pyridoxal 5'-phosphate synthase glutaminase subunit PdxT [Bacteroidaceae bacterium]|nr:pyridoxal 5'-phosphate synthase glutaminase subunit PdxT [Bacteroidaceae bacterium]